MFNNSKASNCGGGGGGSNVDTPFDPNSNSNNNHKRLENGSTDVGTAEEIPNETNKSSLDKNSNREIFTMDSLNRNSLSGNWWVATSDDTRSYFYKPKQTQKKKNNSTVLCA